VHCNVVKCFFHIPDREANEIKYIYCAEQEFCCYLFLSAKYQIRNINPDRLTYFYETGTEDLYIELQPSYFLSLSLMTLIYRTRDVK